MSTSTLTGENLIAICRPLKHSETLINTGEPRAVNKLSTLYLAIFNRWGSQNSVCCPSLRFILGVESESTGIDLVYRTSRRRGSLFILVLKQKETTN